MNAKWLPVTSKHFTKPMLSDGLCTLDRVLPQQFYFELKAKRNHIFLELYSSIWNEKEDSWKNSYIFISDRHSADNALN